MERKTKRLTKGSTRWRICALAVLCGELPVRSLKCLSWHNPSIAHTSAKRLVEIGYLREEKRRACGEWIRTLRPTQKLLKENLFPGCRRAYELAQYFSSAGGSKAQESKKVWSAETKKKKRSLRNAEAAAFMEGSGACVIPGTKPEIARCSEVEYAAYYTSRELAEILTVDQRYRATGRAVGYLVMHDGRIFQTFSLHATNIELREVTEADTLSVASTEFHRILADKFQPITTQLILASRMTLLKKILEEQPPSPYMETPRAERLRADPSRYTKQIFLPKTPYGIQHMMIIMNFGGDAIKTWAIGIPPMKSGPYDAEIEGYGYILSFLDGNIQKLRWFLDYAKLHPEHSFTIGCFTYQESALRELTEEIPNISFANSVTLSDAMAALGAAAAKGGCNV